jgi:hypothetical protein
MATTFFVHDASGTPIPAKILTDSVGNPVVNPNYGNNFSIPNSTKTVNWGQDGALKIYDAAGNAPPSLQSYLKYAIVPESFDLAGFLEKAIIAGSGTSGDYFWAFGEGNIQTHHAKTDKFTLAFTDANSILLGMFDALTGSNLGFDADVYNDIMGVQATSRNQKNRSAGEKAINGQNFERLIKRLQQRINPDWLAPDFQYTIQCFPSFTPIQISKTETKPISKICVGDVVMSFDPKADGGRGALVPKRVKRLFRNNTTEWIKLTWLENGEAKELVATPGHHMLDQNGAFTRLELMVQNGKAEIVLASGVVIEAKAERITYSAETAHLFEQTSSHARSAANASMKFMN